MLETYTNFKKNFILVFLSFFFISKLTVFLFRYCVFSCQSKNDTLFLRWKIQQDTEVKRFSFQLRISYILLTLHIS